MHMVGTQRQWPDLLIMAFLSPFLLSFVSNHFSSPRSCAPAISIFFSHFFQACHFLQASVVLHMPSPLPKMAGELLFILQYLLLIPFLHEVQPTSSVKSFLSHNTVHASK